MTIKRRIKLGILGAGEMAARHIGAVAGSEVVKIVGVSGAGDKSLKRISDSFGLQVFEDKRELYEVCDAVDICLPTFLHEEAVVEAAVAGKHVLCEKPVALNMAVAAEMIKVCDEAGVLFMVAHCLRFWPEYVFLKEIVDKRKYGEAVSFTAWRFGGMPGRASENWLLDESKSGGPAIDLQIHDTDMVLHLFGMPESVRAMEKRVKNISSVSAEYIFSGGPVVRAEAGWFFEEGYSFRQGYRAVFEEAVIEFHSDRERPVAVFREGEVPYYPVFPVENAYRNEIEYFGNCVKTGAEPKLSSARDGANALSIAIAVCQAATSGMPVSPSGIF